MLPLIPMNSLRRRVEGIVVRQIRGEVLALDVAAERIHYLNQTASFIWEQYEHGASREEIAAELVRRFDVSLEVAAGDVTRTLQSLFDLKLLAET